MQQQSDQSLKPVACDAKICATVGGRYRDGREG